jgi:hypothetical protein
MEQKKDTPNLGMINLCQLMGESRGFSMKRKKKTLKKLSIQDLQHDTPNLWNF